MTDATKAKMGIARVPPAMINRFTTSRSAAMASPLKAHKQMNTQAESHEHMGVLK